MYNFILEYQLNIMLALCAICAMMAILLLITRFLPTRRRWILIFTEIVATSLLGFDRMAYIFRGDVSHTGYVMVRLSNCMVFVLTSAVVFAFNMYLVDLIADGGRLKNAPTMLKVTHAGAIFGMLLAVFAHFTGLYYYFDEQNIYHRGQGFLLCYVVPVCIPLLQFVVVYRHKKMFSKLIYASLMLYIFVPICMGILQIFTYGISIVNMAMVMVSIALYFFAYTDINNEVIRAHGIEVENLEKEQRSIKRLFNQTAKAFVTAVEKRDEYTVGHSERVAAYAGKIAAAAGMNKEECEKVYYTALLHDVGMIGIPDSILDKDGALNEEEREFVKNKPLFSSEILSSITEYPYLSQGAKYTCERYDGEGYPEGLKGDAIPEPSRIIAVADAYDTMTSKKSFRDALSYQIVREEFIKQAGHQFDPEFTEIMVRIMDQEYKSDTQNDGILIEKEINCEKYRNNITKGIRIDEQWVELSFKLEKNPGRDNAFSEPALILFESYDMCVHTDEKTIEEYNYVEYGEIWFDGHYVSTGARNIEEKRTETDDEPDEYKIRAGRFEDHLSLTLTSLGRKECLTVALPNNSKPVYIALTGENCRLYDITAVNTGAEVTEGEIKKIVNKINYTDRLESDLPNVQIDRFCSAATEGVFVDGEVIIDFHTMSLPESNLVWHCPYIVLYYSKDGIAYGEDYKEYTLLKINGEGSGDNESAYNRFSMKKAENFAGWEDWKQKNIAGMECSVKLARKGNRIITSTENLGIEIENTTIIKEAQKEVYAALTGHQVALTDIRIR